MPWESGAGSNVPINPDPANHRFVYDAADAPEPFTVGGAGSTSLDLTWPAGSLVAGSSFTLDLRLTRDLAGYPQEHVHAPLTIGRDMGGGGGEGGATSTRGAGGADGGSNAAGAADPTGGTDEPSVSCECRSTPGAPASRLPLAVLPVLLAIARRRELGVVARVRDRSPWVIALAVAVLLALLLIGQSRPL